MSFVRKRGFHVLLACISLVLINDVVELLSWRDSFAPSPHLRSDSGDGLDEPTKLRYVVNLFLVSPLVLLCLIRFAVALSPKAHAYLSTWTRSVTLALLLPALLLLLLLAIPARPSLGDLPPNHTYFTCDANASSGRMDAVYTWVNVTDPEWQALSVQHKCPVEGYLGGGGDADPFLALKYSMRSVRAHLPFIERIFIVTERNQVPSWVSLGENVHVIFHDEFMPAEIVPTFNSNPTEMLLHRMVAKGILRSNCFVYLNDDFIVHKPLEPSDLITSDGRIVFNSFVHINLPYDKWMDAPYGLWPTTDARVAFVVDPHVPYVVHAEAMEAYVAQCGDECTRSMETRCKRNGPLPMSKYQDFLATKHPEAVRFVSPLYGYFTRLPLGIASPTLNGWLLYLLNPKFVYIESHNALEEYPEWVDFITTYLHTSFPHKAPWEL
ncbi:hypothetical protein SPRG_19244 [Saprolegnia parasitica CBS 223.65]|uniref:Stealth protein CR2 conserved region 2 domain-containing protein n=1 Tax=Saprolegnia parasitica (strain CBS 223.65) TaxID=695850 RepID=A0A067D3N2_SAPPC|nr:hypothetical protein SPRG_19244 [Saprolegnia parasitica CBS 223.65]KDO33617.1 hypothetical protein SPRG_19244 [Saprolegnia parasitica CBS 223.65]|eukprot:XP_012195663.1 hypothetical protein SPRG_19244 [Saprolegnia parasitica CBS 223.65]